MSRAKGDIPCGRDSILIVVAGVSQSDLKHAAELLRAGRLVAFPTETVYGLGANALSAEAVARIFEAKGRPRTSPLIVHVATPDEVSSVVSHWPEVAQRLTAKFWPGPLTLVLPKTEAVPDIVTAGLPTVGIRMPRHDIALALLRECGLPLAAPSANRFTQVSPTTAEHVRRSLGDRVDFILDGGPCTVGIESTVLSLATPQPTILRPGGISRTEIESLIGSVAVSTEAASGAHASPGMHAKHYSPHTRLLLSKDGEVPHAGHGIYLRLFHDAQHPCEAMYMPTDPREYAAALYGTLHDLDARSLDWIAVELPPVNHAWEAVLDRLRRAAHP
ncbi:MAG TPA: L-threonylcarbamoyladenylate synthase [Terriglobales bacterium]|nr:L-threonylcarbamoyladenylate synthase [Terriglobales bacterium]